MFKTGGRLYGYFHAEPRQIASISKRYPEPCVQINPEIAKVFGIDAGD